MKLSGGSKGKCYIIKNIDLDIAVKRRLQMLGMTHDTVISVLNKKSKGPMIIRVRGMRYALGKGFCDGILVEEKKQ